jgi:hypothetical protein
MILTFHVKCQLCGNSKDKEFYYTPEEEAKKDGLVLSPVKYILICKLCGTKIHLELKES